MADFTIKRNDLLPDMAATLKGPDGSPTDITGCLVRFHMKLDGALTPKIDQAATIVDATEGTVKYSWSGTDTDTAGNFLAEFQVRFPPSTTGKFQTFPNDRQLVVAIIEDLA